MARILFISLGAFLFFMPFQSTHAQIAEDILLIEKKSLLDSTIFKHYKRKGNDAKMMDMKNKSFIEKANPFTLFLRSSMFIYQNVISPQLSRTCAFEITCSNFAKQAIKQFGFVKGMALTADRLSRCNRIALLDVSPLDINERDGTIIDPILKFHLP